MSVRKTLSVAIIGMSSGKCKIWESVVMKRCLLGRFSLSASGVGSVKCKIREGLVAVRCLSERVSLSLSFFLFYQP